MKGKVVPRRILLFGGVVVILAIIVAVATVYSTFNRTQVQFDISQNEELIYLSTYAEPPQFAIWLEDPGTNRLETVFVTSRVATGDWEGKASVPVALPRWHELFRDGSRAETADPADGLLAVTGATPKENYFSVRAEVKPGSSWICWIEVNLAGDYNEAFPEFDEETMTEDDYACGQPALLYKAQITAVEGFYATPRIVAQSVWQDGVNRIEPVSDGVTTAIEVFSDVQISVSRPKPKLIDKYKIRNK